MKWVGLRINLVRQLFRVTTIEHIIGGDVNEPKIILDGEDREMPWNTRIQLRGRKWI